MSNCPECQPSTLTIHGEKTLREEIERLTAEVTDLHGFIRSMIEGLSDAIPETMKLAQSQYDKLFNASGSPEQSGLMSAATETAMSEMINKAAAALPSSVPGMKTVCPKCEQQGWLECEHVSPDTIAAIAAADSSHECPVCGNRNSPHFCDEDDPDLATVESEHGHD